MKNKASKLTREWPRRPTHIYQCSTSQGVGAQPRLRYFLVAMLRHTDKSNLRERDLFQRIIDHHVWEGVAVGSEDKAASQGGMAAGREGVATGREGVAVGRGRGSGLEGVAAGREEEMTGAGGWLVTCHPRLGIRKKRKFFTWESCHY